MTQFFNPSVADIIGPGAVASLFSPEHPGVMELITGGGYDRVIAFR
jgi:hypothetical protein